MGCPLARDQTGTADIQIALWDGLLLGMGSRLKVVPHMCERREPPKKMVHSLSRRVWVSFFFLLQYSLDTMGVYDKG